MTSSAPPPGPSAPPTDGRGGGSSASRPLLQVEHLSKLYPIEPGWLRKPAFVHAVDDVTFYVRRGETLGLVGESGCGKTTLGRTILRLVEPTLGRILFDGHDVTRMPPRELRALRRRMQIVFQDPASSLDPRMTVREIVAEGIACFRLARTRADEEALVEGALARVGLHADLMGRYPHELSGGERQRVGIARALAVDPDFVVCDEPVSALDVSVQAQIVNLLEELQEASNTSLLFISHDLRVVAWVSHRIAVMHLGRIVEMGPASEVAEKQLHPYTRALFAAVPSVGPSGAGGRPRRLLAGEPPDAASPPAGCSFHTRCPHAERGRCDIEVPPLEPLTEGSRHRVACFHPETDLPA